MPRPLMIHSTLFADRRYYRCEDNMKVNVVNESYDAWTSVSKKDRLFFTVPVKKYNPADCLRTMLAPVAHFIWPVDVVKVNGNASYVFAYTKNAMLLNLKSAEHKRNMSVSDFIRERLRITGNDYFEAVKVIASNIIDIADEFYQKGWAYYGWDADLLYVTENYDVIALFSEQINNIEQIGVRPSSDVMTDFQCDTNAEDTPGEFVKGDGIDHLFWDKTSLEPEKRDMEDGMLYHAPEADLYNLTVLLFRVLVGNYPYHGSLMNWVQWDESAVISNEQKKVIGKEYRNVKTFIFDPDDDSNCINQAYEETLVPRWKALPESVKSFFIKVFTRTGIDPDDPLTIHTIKSIFKN